MPKTPQDVGFLAGAALAARHPMACHDHPIGGLWPQRLARANAAALARHAGRTEDEAALRPATAGVMPGICAARGMTRDPPGVFCKLGGGSPRTIRWTKLSPGAAANGTTGDDAAWQTTSRMLAPRPPTSMLSSRAGPTPC
jgi:Protein of unknown function (DUF1403)